MIRSTVRIGFWIGVGAIVVLSVVPGPQIIDAHVWDKLRHAVAYASIATLATIGWTGRSRHYLIAFTLALGAVFELIQTFFLPDRVGDVGDMVANMIGVTVGYALGWAIRSAFMRSSISASLR